MPNPAAHHIDAVEQLARLYGAPVAASIAKEIDYVHPHYRAFIEAAPFVVLATAGADGLDASPRGGAPGFVVVEDEKTLLLPDRPGNNRLDSLRNIVADPRVALLFLVPGVGETLRVNGTARISTAPASLERFRTEGNVPRTVIVIRVEKAYFQCARATLRAKLWDPAEHLDRARLPSLGTILRDITGKPREWEDYDRRLAERLADSLY